MGNDKMLRELDAKERAAKTRRISGDMHVTADKTDALVKYIRERLGGDGFDAKLNRHCEPGNPELDEDDWDVIDVWCVRCHARGP
jgi:hypothetical protein